MDLKHYVLENQPLLVKKAVRENPALVLQLDDDGRTPLFWAVSQNSPEMTAEILSACRTQSKFNIEHADEAGWTVLHVAAAVGNPDLLELILSERPDINAKTNGGQTALFAAVSKLHYAAVDSLLTAGASASTKDKSGTTPLQRAAAVGAIGMVRKLLEHKAPINASDNDGWTALHHAYAEGHGEIVVLLIRGGADTTRETKDGQTPEQVAADKKVVQHVAFELSPRE